MKPSAQNSPIERVASKEAQLTLFPMSLKELCTEFECSKSDISQWHKLGWISFEPDENRPYHQPEQTELEFISSLAHFGLARDTIQRLLAALGFPYYYDASRCGFNFKHAQWIGLHDLPDARDVIESNLYEYCDELASESDYAKLIEIRDEVQKRLDHALLDDHN